MTPKSDGEVLAGKMLARVFLNSESVTVGFNVGDGHVQVFKNAADWYNIVKQLPPTEAVAWSEGQEPPEEVSE